PVPVEQEIKWMDGHRYIYSFEGQSYIVDFDGSNEETLVTSLLDSGLFLIARRPLINALGLETRAQYFDRIQPEYSEALKLVNNLPKESMVYFLFEPRSYNMKPFVQPDPINSNLMHDYYIYKTPERIISSWKSSGYTHILVNNASALFIEKEEHIEESKIKEIINLLHLKKKGQSYSLYIIP
ncbi:MAG TPA: hypothetical protein PLL95_17595, partial [Anaerolineales bacterium]|nr:hypothetical protein [Anaerolineales bacterium]